MQGAAPGLHFPTGIGFAFVGAEPSLEGGYQVTPIQGFEYIHTHAYSRSTALLWGFPRMPLRASLFFFQSSSCLLCPLFLDCRPEGRILFALFFQCSAKFQVEEHGIKAYK